MMTPLGFMAWSPTSTKTWGGCSQELDALGLQNDTIVIYLTDNGPQQKRFNGIWRDLKGTVYEGGIHTACLLRWPGKFKAGIEQAQLAAHIDLTPTLLAACQVDRPDSVAFDGISLLPWLVGERTEPLERTLFFQWHRGDVPEKFRACACAHCTINWCSPTAPGTRKCSSPSRALYDIDGDPGEQHNVINAHPQVAAELQAAYEKWFADVGSTRGFPRPRIIVGTSHENPLTLTRQDWRGPKAAWGNDALGDWQVEVAAAGVYDVTVRVPAADDPRTIKLRIANRVLEQPLAAGQDRVVYKGVRLEPGTCDVEAQVESPTGVSGRTTSIC